MIPKNAIGLTGDKIILGCAADKNITWHHDHQGITGPGCSNRTYATTAGSSATRCSVIVGLHGADALSLSGVYRCHYDRVDHLAIVIVVGQYAILTNVLAVLCVSGKTTIIIIIIIPGQCLWCCHHAVAALREFTLVHAVSAPRRQVAADLWTKPIGLNHKPACRLPVNYTHHRHFIITQPEILIVPSHGR